MANSPVHVVITSTAQDTECLGRAAAARQSGGDTGRRKRALRGWHLQLTQVENLKMPHRASEAGGVNMHIAAQKTEPCRQGST
jgi:hypothetical protein